MVAVGFCFIFHTESERKVKADKTAFIIDRVSDDDMGVAITQRWMPLAGLSSFCSGLANYEYEIWYLHRAGVQDGTAQRKRRRRSDIFLPEN